MLRKEYDANLVGRADISFHGIGFLFSYMNRLSKMNVDIREHNRKFHKSLNIAELIESRYWNWPLYASNLAASPLFDGSEYSLSGDGAYIANNSDIILGPGVVLPHGSGGGCVTSGPFVNMTVPFRAFQFAEALEGTEPADRFDYTPRCLSRDLNTYIAETYTNQSDVDALIFGSATMADFQDTMSGVPGTYAMGVHGGGHFTLGPIGSDMFASPGDPAFYLHHGMIDRVWTIWQALDPANRQYQISGTGTFLNIPPSANITLDDTINWGVLGPEMTVRNAMSVTAGPFCYVYI
jgi:tyrosinase